MAHISKIIAALIWVAGCTNSQSGPSQTAVQVPSTATEKGAPVSTIKDPITLKANWYHEDGICIQFQEDGPCLKSLSEMREAAPNLHKRTEHLGALAQIIHRFHPGISQEVFPRLAGYQAWWTKAFEPADFFDREQGNILVRPSGPNVETLHDVKLDGDRLIYFSGRMIGPDHGVQVFRNEVDFASNDWTPKITELETTEQPRKGLNDRTIAIFGALAEGYAHAKLPAGDVYLAAKPAAGASAFVWRNSDQKIERFKDWASLLAKHPEAASPEAANQLAYAFANYPLSSGRQLIKDSAAYKTEYTDGDWGLEKLRYHVDQMRITRYTIADWDGITDPVIKDGVLVAHFQQGRQPSRMTYRIADFANDTEAEYVDLATSKTISDSKGGPPLTTD